MICQECGVTIDDDYMYNEYLDIFVCKKCYDRYMEGIRETYIEMKGDNDYPWGNAW